MAEKTFRVCISIKIKTALREGGLFGLTQVCFNTPFYSSSNQKAPNLLWEVGCGRRVRGSANLVNITGGILPEKQDESRKFRSQNAECGMRNFILHSDFCNYSVVR